MRAVNTELAILAGQLFALLLLAALCLPAGVSLATFEFSQIRFEDFRPLMILPPLLLTVGAFLTWCCTSR